MYSPALLIVCLRFYESFIPFMYLYNNHEKIKLKPSTLICVVCIHSSR